MNNQKFSKPMQEAHQHENRSRPIKRNTDEADALDISNIRTRTLNECSDTKKGRMRTRECFCTIEKKQEHKTSLFIAGYEQTLVSSIENAVVPLQSYLPDIHEKIEEIVNSCSAELETQAQGKLTRDELMAIYLYTMEWKGPIDSLYRQLNRAMREANKAERMEPWFGYLKLLLSALFKIPSEHRLIWRGIKGYISNDYNTENEITWWSISSCTESVDVLETDQFLGKTGKRTLFSIECCRGKVITPYSAFPDESEIVLLPGTQLRFVAKISPAPDLRIIHLKEIVPVIPILPMPMTAQEIKHERIKYRRKVDQSCIGF